MERRHFINLGLTGVAASLIAPQLTLAGDKSSPMAGSVYYTKENAGRWSKKIAGHLPTIEIQHANGKVIVDVVTAHGMDGYQHYIVKHVLLDQDYNFLDEKMFNPNKDKVPMSRFTLENYKSATVHVLSMCNKHDVWLNSARI